MVDGAAQLKAIIFDFDGVIVESLEVKTEAFRTLFADHPEHVDAIVQLHVENPGVSRYEKFRRIYRDFFDAELDEREMTDLDRRFSALVYERVIACALVAGATEFLGRTASAHALYVASATPEEELRRIVQARDLARFFDDVRGSPASKEAIVAEILSTSGIEPRQALFIGDALSDYRSATNNGVPFIGRVPDGEPNPFDGLGVETVTDLRELSACWPEILEPLGVGSS